MNRYCLGLDIGSTASKAVIFDNSKIVSSAIMPSGTNYANTSTAVKASALKYAGLNLTDITASAATGTGGRNSGADKYLGEIICNARGINFLYPTARTIIDIGGQGSQVITLDDAGLVINFNASETCATGSARLLQVLARILQVGLDELGPLSFKSSNPSNFSTSCSVFIETEIITRISQGDKPQDIAAGVHRSIAEKIGSLSRGVKLEQDIIVIGGGALDSGLIRSIEDVLQIKVQIPDNPRIVTALGAAITACGH